MDQGNLLKCLVKFSKKSTSKIAEGKDKRILLKK